ncbi:matrix metalloproteinase [Striga asiatica]|uniref:Matrix metalloproteinase n=1 Tax=Striga asiatica TaxID=4170 RepID=A0A5A7QTX1_STRAF|nr:matrix metalloproteinase [Striga asiatica]
MDFLKPLIGLRKGQSTKGIQDLKNYLDYLGYYLKNNNTSFTNNNLFDNSLESALRKYQKFYNLKVTGLLDPRTIAKLHEPRCGMPDFHNNSINKLNSDKFRVSSHYAFLPGRPKWRKTKLSYIFNTNVNEEAIMAFERAMKEWARVTRFTFFRAKDVGRSNIRISFLRGHHGDDYPFVGPQPRGGLAHSFPPPNGRIHFDAAQNWSHNGDRNAFDVETVGLHELGHVLGLDHSNVQLAVMHAIIAPGERKHLHEDDIKGIKALYRLK